MTITYQCRHCGQEVGKLEQQSCTIDKLGFNQLTNQERQEMIEYHNDGTMTVKTICEDCQEALERNPHYHQLHSFIQ
ncbi:anti-sigma-F factor Fin family protein [Pseudalkalibacillus caeni]|uniref:Anti-sigma-F factor Fin family protein n=1 Tax=Exobacillus caeni TaxID=2574798 RepID=A0A5R9F3T0_9BACL|nr:anti-sigma-F factor Fin family protein [Pseudalkalibacillus caeni]TLS35114.1 anti-sigma-F factor Fin family protein [Pseudalkalibacillus caeni]